MTCVGLLMNIWHSTVTGCKGDFRDAGDHPSGDVLVLAAAVPKVQLDLRILLC